MPPCRLTEVGLVAKRTIDKSHHFFNTRVKGRTDSINVAPQRSVLWVHSAKEERRTAATQRNGTVGCRRLPMPEPFNKPLNEIAGRVLNVPHARVLLGYNESRP